MASLLPCLNHPGLEGLFRCCVCRGRMCAGCLTVLWKEKYCPACLLSHYDRRRPRTPTAFRLAAALAAGLAAGAVLAGVAVVAGRLWLMECALLVGLCCGWAVRLAAGGQVGPVFRLVAAGTTLLALVAERLASYTLIARKAFGSLSATGSDVGYLLGRFNQWFAPDVIAYWVIAIVTAWLIPRVRRTT